MSAPSSTRTPEDRFAGLPDFPFAPHYREVDGLRLAHLDEGPADAAPVVFVHGEPTWSFLWRHVMAPVLEAGFRCLAPDHAGFGRSDKPVDLGWYSYERHVDLFVRFLDDLDLRGATVVVHDWGGPIGLAAAVARPERIARIVVMDTGLFTGRQHMSEAWEAFRAFIERTEDPPVSMLVRGACATEPDETVVAAYDAPFPDARSKAGVRAFPLLIPLTPEAPGAALGQSVLAALAQDPRPKLVLWADDDPVLPLRTGERFAEAIGAAPPEVIAGASHFLQEDAGPAIGRRIASWLREQGA